MASSPELNLLARWIPVALLAVLAFAANAAASSPPTITVGPGDALAVKGSDIQCVISTSTPRAIVCGLAGQKSARAHSYAMTMADEGVAIFAATGSHKIVARAINPSVSGPAIKGSGHKPAHYVLANHEDVLVAGTHVECAAIMIDNHTRQTIGCGILNASSGGYYVAGTYAATLSDHYAGILRAGTKGAQTVVAIQKQP
jgi:hypothetical protein